MRNGWPVSASAGGWARGAKRGLLSVALAAILKERPGCTWP